ncbi:Signal transduction histidine kinase [Promicromonospora umidemergens]|uniref:Signal transduction histidine kinase subgroup 3 dimerisation and phosphoacceptor domain-containing protein n=1 Tax=Promicromonospora umidemergens TaxID=629679 RepID=A0ABP8WQ00_9MICO|nr:histidine kinase [Promicromonospora umidemergens]MCP2283377.1 Signal transduction histidine kinase [Promicromonospora umidemergens]
MTFGTGQGLHRAHRVVRMRRLGTDEWSGLVMLAVAVAVGGPVLFGPVDPTIPRPWWVALFVVLFVTLLLAIVRERADLLRNCLYATAVVASWAAVLTTPHLGLLPVLLVIVAAVSVYVVPLWAGFVVVGLNTAVLAIVMAFSPRDPLDALITLGFYLLIQVASMLSSAALIREQRLRRELSQAHIDLRAASALLSESARTAERLRISRDLHDLIGHQLTVLTLELEAARHREGEQAREHVERANRVARDLLADVRLTVSELRTASSDLSETLRQVVRDLPDLEVTVDVEPDVQVDEEQAAALVRAVQEIATNTMRHADAKALWIEVAARPHGVVLTAVDDGRGYRELVPGNGLRGLAERFEALGGGVEFDGGDGFRVTARVPA